ncbi:cytochrome c oxidase subunit II [uncultured Thermanaerothrix sp.]|uniref:cytochrome c oxidase subunit II n=1 Tax=uncultured Thermanaerothrix sp. TaxID=1195149 RepID=UPI00262D01D1|nr:cytochrome c oxidase subunit II [uncultured Thermanaerothrix sp.]
MMGLQQMDGVRKVLIASANPLFGRGLERLIHQQWRGRQFEIRVVGTMEETLTLLESWLPDLVILDYDDRSLDRKRFMDLFVSSQRTMQVMLVSLQESGSVVVYDRRVLTPSQAEDWLLLSEPSGFQPSPSGKERTSSMKHLAIVASLVVILTLATNYLLNTVQVLPLQASVQAQPIDRLFNLQFMLIAFFFSLIVAFMGYSVVVFRQRARDEDEEGAYIKGSTGLEVVWTIIPIGIVIYLSYLGSLALAETRRIDPQAIEVKVVAGQWFWRFEYPQYGITSNTLYLPVNRQAHLRLTSLDVIHSFWVPEFRVKQDALPGANLERELRVTPTMMGQFKVRCAELCGTSHAYMESPVVVVSQADFEAWVGEQLQAIGADPATRGAKWAQTNGCLSCHSVDGSPGVGPTWKGLYGRTDHELADGSRVTVDENYLRVAILNPNAQVVKGYPSNVMPGNYQALLSDQQINDIIEYIKTLR